MGQTQFLGLVLLQLLWVAPGKVRVGGRVPFQLKGGVIRDLCGLNDPMVFSSVLESGAIFPSLKPLLSFPSWQGMEGHPSPFLSSFSLGKH